MRAQQSPPAPATNAATTNAADDSALTWQFASSLARLGFNGEAAAIALSGGGDSVALLHLFVDWAHTARTPLPVALIVDHGLREGSAADAVKAMQWAKARGYSAEVLLAPRARGRANIEEQARELRYALLGSRCQALHLKQLFVAHTLDDQAETFLLRLARGSGVDGLSAMRPRAAFPLPEFAGLELVRPLLAIRRAELREYLTLRGIGWLEDPMNTESRFARVRIREALPALEAAGVPAFRIAQAAAHLARGREALDAACEAFLASHARALPDGGMLLDGAALQRAPREIGLRALATVLGRVSDASRRPRFDRLESLFDAIAGGNFNRPRTLHGCLLKPAIAAEAVFGGQSVRIARESRRKSAGETLYLSPERSGALRSQRSKLPQKRRNITR